MIKQVQRYFLLIISILLSYSFSFSQPNYLATGLSSSWQYHTLTDLGNIRQVSVPAGCVGGNCNEWAFLVNNNFGTCGAPACAVWRPYNTGSTNVSFNAVVAPNSGSNFGALYNDGSSSGSQGNASYFNNPTVGSYYTFNITENASSDNTFMILETPYAPTNLAGTVTTTTGGNISVSGLPTLNSGENLFLRYSTSPTMSSSSLLQLSPSGGSVSVNLPSVACQSSVIYYYFYTSNRTSGSILADAGTYGEIAHELSTLRVLMPSLGSYYSLTYGGPVVVTSSAGTTTTSTVYADLGTAASAINGGVHDGVITVDINGTHPAVAATISFTNDVNNTSILIRPSCGAVRTISGNVAAQLIFINGADNVTFDGLNTGGNGLIIENTNATNTPNVSTIQLNNDAIGCTIQNCELRGSSLLTTAQGVISVLASTGTGCDNTTIQNNKITKSGTNYPVNGIVLAGSATATLNNISILNNEIFDFFNAGADCAGVRANGNTVGVTVSGNHFYETQPLTFAVSGSIIFAPIHFTSTTNTDNLTITNNYIGGSTINCGGTALTINSSSNVVRAIKVSTSIAPVIGASIQGNTIQNMVINSTSTSNAPAAISLVTGKFKVGNITGNTIGSNTAANGITFTSNSTANTAVFSGISCGSGTVDTAIFKNNTIVNISGGGVTTSALKVRGINAVGTGIYQISNNTIKNLTNTVAVTTAAVSGISFAGTTIGANNIQQNTITDLSANAGAVVWGIETPTGFNANPILSITQNTVKRLVNTSTSTVTGISCALTNAASRKVRNNVVDSLVNTAGTAVVGIAMSGAGPTADSITNNTVKRLIANSGTITGINFTVSTSLSVGHFINSNTIDSLVNTAGTAITGISTSGTGPSTEVVSSNMVKRLTANSGTITGISFNITTGVVTPTATHTVTNNTIQDLTNTAGTAITGISFAGAGTANTFTNNIAKRFVANAGTITGLSYSTSGANHNISNNLVDSLVTNNTATAATGFLVSGNSASSNNVNTNTIKRIVADVGNVIGLSFTSASAGANHTIANNLIDSLVIKASAATLYGLNVANFVGATTTSTFNNNTIRKLYSTSGAIEGIRVFGSANVIHNFTNNLLHTFVLDNTTANSYVRAINSNYATGGVVNISNNTIRDISSGTTGGEVVGIYHYLSGSNTGQSAVIATNLIHSLEQTNPAGGSCNVQGIYSSMNTTVPTSTTISANTIHSLNAFSTDATTQLRGIQAAAITATSGQTIFNNMIRLGIDKNGNNITTGYAINGLGETSNGINTFSHNSVFIGGLNVAASSPTSAFASVMLGSTSSVRNNIFANLRSNATTSASAKHTPVAVSFASGMTLDNNLYYAPNTDGAVGQLTGGYYYTLCDWRVATGKEANAVYGDPNFVAPTANATTVDLHIQSPTAAESKGINVGISGDIDGNVRNATTPDLGADEGNFTPFNYVVSINLDSVNAICQGSTTFNITYNTPIGSPDKYSLTSSDMAGFASISNLALPSSPINVTIPSGIAPGVYHFTLTVKNYKYCIGVDYPFTLTIITQPSLTITNPPAVCAPATVNLTASSITAGSTLPTGTTLSYWTNAAATTALSNPSAVASSGTYYIKASNNGCTDVKPVVVTINPAPVLFITDPLPVCAPTTVDLTDPSVTTGSTLPTGTTLSYWTDVSATTALSNPSAVATSGTYYIKGETSTGCISVQPVIVTINPSPNLVITNPAAVCEPSTIDLTATSVTTGSTLPTGTTLSYWTNLATTTALSTPSAVATSGTYYIKAVTGLGCTDVKPVSVTINPAPNLVITNPAAVCEPSTIDLTAASVTTGSTLPIGTTLSYWTNASATSSLSTPSAVATSGTYYIKAVTGAGCSDVKPVSVTINPTPSLVITNPAAVCEPNTVDLTATSVTTGSTLPAGTTLSYWTNASATTSLSTPNAVATSGTYYIKAATGAGCNDVKPVSVTINSNPAAPTTTDKCSYGSSVTLSATGSGGTLKWFNVNNPSGVPLATGATYNATTSSTYYVFEQNGLGCYSAGAPAVATLRTGPSTNIPTVSGDYWATDVVQVGTWTHYCRCQDDYLILSLDLNGQNIGNNLVQTNVAQGNAGNQYSVRLHVNPSSSVYVPVGTPYLDPALAPLGWWLIPRAWDVFPHTQPSSPVGVRSYYTSADYTSLNNDITLGGGIPLSSHEQLIMYKLLGLEASPKLDAAHNGITQAQIKLYANWTYYTPWVYGNFAPTNPNVHYGQYSVSSFSGGGGGGGSNGVPPFPITLTAFSGKTVGKQNLLFWTTSSEFNASHFEVERSVDGVSFEQIGKVQAKGGINQTTNYDFTDVSPYQGSNFYRLKMLDLDGTSKRSNIVELNNAINFGVSIYPNPAETDLYLTLDGIEGNFAFKLFNSVGQTVMNQKLFHVVGTTEHIELKDFAKGVYQYQISYKGETLNGKILIGK